MGNIYGKTRESLETYFTTKGYKTYKALQIFEWLYQKKVMDFTLFTNLKKELIEDLKKDFEIKLPKIIRKEEDVLTSKFLFELEDDEHVEAVLMRHDYGISVCVSSQVGCNMSCAFCESGRLKKVRNLETHEMVGQILAIEKECGVRISSVVVMGIGEPFDNYENVIDFVKIINDAKGLAIGARHITISTCGIVPKIIEFSKVPLQINLAISLHAPNDNLRSELMPINKVYNLSKLIPAIKEYIALTNRRVTIEYVMLDNRNDSVECAKELASLLKGMNVYVNLIPYNETNHLEFKKTNRSKILEFGSILKENGINVTIRKEFGGRISAACGQLRSKEVE